MKSVRPVAPPAVRWITRTLEDAGFETWTVGGAIRDALLGHPHGDWDLATRATPGDMRRIFRRTVPLGVEHGTIGVLARDGTMYEVTTFRKDVETDGRHAVVAFAQSIQEDLGRRDFTINVIAWHVLRDEFYDPFEGARDLRAGILRTVGEAEERFREDYLRILRALRFAGRFNLSIHEDTWSALEGLVGHLSSLSPERVREELLKVLGQDRTPSRSLRLYATSGALAVLYPELEESLSGEEWEKALGRVDHLPRGRPHLRLSALLRGVPQDRAAALLMRMRLSNAQTDEAARLASADPLPGAEASDADVRRWLGRCGPYRLERLARIDMAGARFAAESSTPGPTPGEVVSAWRRAREIRRSRPPLVVGDLAFGGRDLMRLGFKPGPMFGSVLERLLDWVLDDPGRNEPELLEAEARRILDESPAPDG
jgi:tRNA nucleotidyltransferase (CCA-adding enzyme)